MGYLILLTPPPFGTPCGQGFLAFRSPPLFGDPESARVIQASDSSPLWRLREGTLCVVTLILSYFGDLEMAQG